MGWPQDDDLTPAVVDILADRLRELDECGGGPFTLWDALTDAAPASPPDLDRLDSGSVLPPAP